MPAYIPPLAIIKKWSIYKYCNCYNFNWGKIETECFDTLDDANKSYHERDKTITNYDSKLIYVNKFLPDVINKFLIQNAFRKPVVFITPTKKSLEKLD